MLFNSLEFLIFLPLVFLLYWYVFGKKIWLQNLFPKRLIVFPNIWDTAII